MTKIEFEDEVVLYPLRENGCWVAHSLRTDQVAGGESIVDSLATLLRGIHGLCQMAESDETVKYLREAPDEIKSMAKIAKRLPLEIYEVAHKMATGEWPADIPVLVKPQSEKPFLATMTEGAGR